MFGSFTWWVAHIWGLLTAAGQATCHSANQHPARARGHDPDRRAHEGAAAAAAAAAEAGQQGRCPG
eukprot:1002941-Pelagomonas_calceolata.AAC.1